MHGRILIELNFVSTNSCQHKPHSPAPLHGRLMVRICKLCVSQGAWLSRTAHMQRRAAQAPSCASETPANTHHYAARRTKSKLLSLRILPRALAHVKSHPHAHPQLRIALVHMPTSAPFCKHRHSNALQKVLGSAGNSTSGAPNAAAANVTSVPLGQSINNTFNGAGSAIAQVRPCGFPNGLLAGIVSMLATAMHTVTNRFLPCCCW